MSRKVEIEIIPPEKARFYKKYPDSKAELIENTQYRKEKDLVARKLCLFTGLGVLLGGLFMYFLFSALPSMILLGAVFGGGVGLVIYQKYKWII